MGIVRYSIGLKESVARRTPWEYNHRVGDVVIACRRGYVGKWGYYRVTVECGEMKLRDPSGETYAMSEMIIAD